MVVSVRKFGFWLVVVVDFDNRDCVFFRFLFVSCVLIRLDKVFGCLGDIFRMFLYKSVVLLCWFVRVWFWVVFKWLFIRSMIGLIVVDVEFEFS